MKTTAKVLFFLLMVITLNAQVKDFPKLTEGEIPGLKITREQTFDGNSLWGYINGGADIFLEYGFNNLLLQEIEVNHNKLKIEIYRMTDPYAAFGIYSVSHYKCEEKYQSLKFSCVTQYQIQCAIGEYYISIINTNGSKDEQELSKRVFDIIISKIRSDEVTLPDIFKNSLLKQNIEQIKYFGGILGVQNGLSEWYDYFDKFEGYEIFVLPTKLFGSAINVAQIKFRSSSDAKLFLANVGIETGDIEKITEKITNDSGRFVKMLNETTMIFVESYSDGAEIKELIKKIL